MAQDIIEFQTGQFSAVFVKINSASLTIIRRSLNKKYKTSPNIYANLSVVLLFTPMLEKINLVELTALFAEYGVHIVGVADWQNDLQKELILTANLSLFGKCGDISAILPEPRYLPVKIIEQDVEEKQVIYAKKGDLIIHGDVKAGAEVVADGNIHIYGKLQGRAMAGINNHIGSIYCQYLDPEFISINSRSLYKKDIPPVYLFKGMRICCQQGKLIFYPF